MSKNLNQLFNLSMRQFDNDYEDVQIMNLYAPDIIGTDILQNFKRTHWLISAFANCQIVLWRITDSNR